MTSNQNRRGSIDLDTNWVVNIFCLVEFAGSVCDTGELAVQETR